MKTTRRNFLKGLGAAVVAWLAPKVEGETEPVESKPKIEHKGGFDVPPDIAETLRKWWDNGCKPPMVGTVEIPTLVVVGEASPESVTFDVAGNWQDECEPCAYIISTSGDCWEKHTVTLDRLESIGIVFEEQVECHIRASVKAEHSVTLEVFENGVLLSSQAIAPDPILEFWRGAEFVLCPNTEYEFKLTSNENDNCAELLVEWYEISWVPATETQCWYTKDVGATWTFDPVDQGLVERYKKVLAACDCSPVFEIGYDSCEGQLETIEFEAESVEQTIDGGVVFNNCHKKVGDIA